MGANRCTSKRLPSFVAWVSRGLGLPLLPRPLRFLRARPGGHSVTERAWSCCTMATGEEVQALLGSEANSAAIQSLKAEG
eukprot:3053719-Rhodomonas_salina.1